MEKGVSRRKKLGTAIWLENRPPCWRIVIIDHWKWRHLATQSMGVHGAAQGNRLRRRSSSSSSSGSTERKRRSNWSLKRYTLARRDVRKLNCHELVCAITACALDIPEMFLQDHRALLQHINFITHRACHNDFKDSAHVDYYV